jgi:hypothetical protein
MAAPRAGGHQRDARPDRNAGRPSHQAKDDDDDFGDTDVASLLD